MSQAKPTYKLNHEVLPYEMERTLPLNAIDSIYSYLRKKPRTPYDISAERKLIELNHLISNNEERKRLKNLISSMELIAAKWK